MATCTPRYLRTGEPECRVCGRSWDPADETPECQGRAKPALSEIADREMARIRHMLGIQDAD